MIKQRQQQIAAFDHVKISQIPALMSQYTQGWTLGFLGEPRVDVLTLDIALDEKYPLQG